LLQDLPEELVEWDVSGCGMEEMDEDDDFLIHRS